ncbi:MAG: AMIN-like domain-containing (lipo)protein [Actinomycetota bacterium]
MRRYVLFASVLVLLVACAGTGPGAGPAADPGEPQEPGVEEPEVLPDSTCENTTGGNPENFPRFVEVELESGETDRITFRFEPEPGAPDEAPLHFINFSDELITDGEGRPVKAAGEAFVVVSFQAVGVDLSGEKPVEVYTGPKRFTPGFGVLLEAVHLGDFEGQVSWGLGLAKSSCFVLEAQPDQITLEFPSA